MTASDNKSISKSFSESVASHGVTNAAEPSHLAIAPPYETKSSDPEFTDSEPSIEHDKQSLGFENALATEGFERGEDPLSADNTQSTESSLSANSTDMPHEARRVLVHLMRQGVIIATQKPNLFDLARRHESYIRRHLSEVYLQLVLDFKSGVVFVARPGGEHEQPEETGAEDSEEEFTSLISKRTLSLYDTLLLLVLRKHYQERESSGEQKITVDIERLESYLTPFLPLTDHTTLDRKKLIARIKEMVKRKVLSTIRGSEDRYEISPVIRYVVNAEFLESMLDEYKRLARDANIDNTSDGGVNGVESKTSHNGSEG